MNVYKSLEAQRADIAHGIFSNSKDLPDAAIRIESKNYAKGALEMLTNATKVSEASDDRKI
jgi:hypothetical protein